MRSERREKAARYKVTNGRGKGGIVEQERGPRDPKLKWEISIGIFVQGHTEFLITPLLMGPVCLLSQWRSDVPVCPCLNRKKGCY